MRKRPWRAAVGVLAVLTGAGLATIPASAAPTAGHHGYTARVTRTEYGIPHVLAPNIGGAGYGYGYAFAQDNLCALADQVVTLEGSRARYFGPDGTNESAGGTSTNLESDVYYRAVNGTGVIRHLLAARGGPSRQARQLVAGYVAGVNKYLRETGVANLPDPTCRGKAWVRPVTALDIWRNVYDISQLGGETSFVAEIANAEPGAGAHVVPKAAAHDDIGSNGWALGSESTRDGHGMALANPHFPWQGAARFYQVQLTVPGLIDVSGASVFGSPMVEIGHNRDLAWTHTVSTAQRFTLFQLALQPGHPDTYLVDGKPERMTSRKITVPVPGSVEHRTVYTSRYGPVLAQGWTDESAFAVRGSNRNNLRTVDEWLGIGRSRTVGDLAAVQRRHQSMPFVNTLAADSTGLAYYADASVVPHVTDAQAERCVDTPQGKQLYPDTTVLDGARSDCRWGNDPDAIEPGIFGPSAAPHLVRRDYVANSNESPWLTTVDAPLTGYPRIYGPGVDPRSPRDRLSHTMIADRRSGADGLGAPGFDLDSLQRTMLGNRVYTAELAKDDVVAMCEAHPSETASDGTVVDVRAACAALSTWDGRADVASRGMVLWHEFWTGGVGMIDPAKRFKVPFDPAHPVTTPNTLDTDLPEVRAAFADAVQRMAAHGVPADVPLGAVQYTVDRIPVQGCLGFEGCFNVTTPASPMLGEDGTYGPVVFGSSFIMAAQLTPEGPRVRTILTYSLSTNPESPHHTDQTVLYQHKQWVIDRFSQADIAAHGQVTTL